MLEKIGLPSKPSQRGNTWVVDASHCQGCSSPFTFINRKHHCRRCGGIFCGRCTQQRMVLRGQGDSPVRICEPCKNLEEAARFEMRYGHKSRAAKGGSKHTSKKEEEILKDILGSDKILSPGKTGASSSYIPEKATSLEGGDLIRNLSLDQPAELLNELGSTTTPEDLRQQAVAEKNKYKTLRAEGKPEEALRAFKRGKELEREAGALEISLRKSRRKALSSPSLVDDNQQIKDGKNKLSTSRKSKETDDLSAELKDLGWSDQDLREVEKRPATLSVEGELSSLLREVSTKPNKDKSTIFSSDKSQVIAHKKRALELKRAGNLVEAKEELKRAKILERKIEEEELLGASDESDDELSSLMRSMDGDEHDHNKSDFSFDFGHITGITDDPAMDGNFEVTDEDMYDPEINSALQSLGWMEEDNTADSEDRESIATEIQSLKRKALNQKRAGNSAEAMSLLKKAKLLEKELENFDTPEMEEPLFPTTDLKSAPKSKLVIQRELLALKKKALALRREGKVDESAEELKKAEALEEQLEDMNKAPSVGNNKQSYESEHATALGNEEEEEEDVTDQDLHDPAYISLLKNLGWEDEHNAEMPRSTASKETNKPSNYTSDDYDIITQSAVNVEIGTSRKSKSRESIATEIQSLKRKALNQKRAGNSAEAMSLLKKAKLLEKELENFDTPEMEEPLFPTTDLKSAPKSKLVIQRELLALKKKALALRREGKVDESAEELKKAEALEEQLEDMNKAPSVGNNKQSYESEHATALGNEEEEEEDVTDQDLHDPAYISLLKNLGWEDEHNAEMPRSTASKETNKPSNYTSDDYDIITQSAVNVEIGTSRKSKSEIQRELLTLKRKALALRRQGKDQEADEVLETAKLLEEKLHEFGEQTQTKISHAPQNTKSALQVDQYESRIVDDSERQVKDKEKEKHEPQSPPATISQPNSSALQQEILAYKKKAIALKREGKLAEAKEALRQAKLLEKNSTNEHSMPQTTTNSSDASVDNKEIASPISVSKPVLSSRDRFKLQQESLGHKRQALKLRREGRTAEADAEFELAKAIESRLQELEPSDSSATADDVVVEDLLDPQLLSMLQSVGLDDGRTSSRPQVIERPQSNADADMEREQLVERIKSEKVKAVSLKRSGKQAEALDALRRAKLYEKKLQALTSK